jgi:trigger factor
VERTGPCECLIRISAGADFLRERYKKELASLQAEAKLPGFRRGRAPIGLVERRMGSSLKSDLISSVISECYEKALEENKLSVVADVEAPDLEKLKWEPGQPGEFQFKCEVLPELELEEKQYKGLKVEKPALELTDDLTAREQERFARQFATWEEVKGPGIDWDDYVEAQLSVLEAGWSQTMGFFPRSERIGPFAVEGIKGVLSGAKAGDEVQVEAKLAEGEQTADEHLRRLAGQTVRLQVTLVHVTRQKVPDFDEELAKKLGLGSLKEMEDVVRERLQAALARRKDQIAQDMAVAGLLEGVSLQLPASLVERATTDEQLRMLVRLLRQGVPREQAEQRAAKAAGQAREPIERRLRASLVLRKLAEKERILVTEPEVDEQIRAFASRQGWREERARSYMEGRGMLRALRDDMREGKTVDFLLQHAEVKEIPTDEFAKRHGGRLGPDESAVPEESS